MCTNSSHNDSGKFTEEGGEGRKRKGGKDGEDVFLDEIDNILI